MTKRERERMSDGVRSDFKKKEVVIEAAYRRGAHQGVVMALAYLHQHPEVNALEFLRLLADKLSAIRRSRKPCVNLMDVALISVSKARKYAAPQPRHVGRYIAPGKN